jgi:hypothetical protein
LARELPLQALVDLLEKDDDQLRGKIVIPQPGDDKLHGQFRSRRGVDQTRTIRSGLAAHGVA